MQLYRISSFWINTITEIKTASGSAFSLIDLMDRKTAYILIIRQALMVKKSF